MSVQVAGIPDEVAAARPWLAPSDPGVPAALRPGHSTLAFKGRPLVTLLMNPGTLVPPRTRP